DIGVPHRELLEDVVLQGARQLVGGHALLLGGDDVHGHHRQHGAVHGHGHGHLVEGDVGEEDLHVLHGVDGDTGLAHTAHHPPRVGVGAAVGGEVEGHRQALLAGGEVALVEGVGLIGGGEAGVLAHRPGAGGVHGCPGPALEG